jgi:pilus assembly protein CpaD
MNRRYPLAVVVILAATVAGCDHLRVPDSQHPRLTDPSLHHPIVVAPQTERLDLALSSGGIADGQAAMEATRFLRRYRRETAGPLNIALPSRNPTVGHIMRTAVAQEGIPADRVRWHGKPADGTVTMSYDRIAAIAPQCGDWSEDVARNPERLPYPNFGCSAQRNMAVMAANPTDLAFPSKETPRIGTPRPGAPTSGAVAGGGVPAAGGGAGGGAAAGGGGATGAPPLPGNSPSAP